MEQYKTVLEGGTGEIVEKKSRFIATVRPVKNEEEALAFLEEMRKKYWDARHNCYAYSIGKNREFTRCSDDGEPSGTAGRPMLVRAYSKAVQEGLAGSLVIEKKKGISLKVTTDYTGIGKIQYIAGERQIPILDSEYTDKVVLKLLVPDAETEAVQKAITEGTNGRAGMEKEKELYFAKVNGEVLTFED